MEAAGATAAGASTAGAPVELSPGGDQRELVPDQDRVCPWRDLPPDYGSWKTIYGRHRRWSLVGTWEQAGPGRVARWV